MGRSRGGLTTKIHALVDADGLPIALKLTEGQAHDGRSAADMLDNLNAGQILLGDRAYHSDGLRNGLAERGAWANVENPCRTERTLPPFSAYLYRQQKLRRTLLQQNQTLQEGIATRYDKRADNYLAGVKLASARTWMRANEVDGLQIFPAEVGTEFGDQEAR